MKLSNSSRRPTAAVLVTAALVAAGCGASTTTTGTSATTTATPAGAGAPAGRPNGPGGGGGTPVVGPAAEKVKAAALAKYPGTIQDITQVPDGSYVAGVVRSSGGSEIHVLVSKSFTVTGMRSGRPGGARPGAPGATPAGPPA
jgi:ABC-type phosphate transport system substrate-binding protein